MTVRERGIISFTSNYSQTTTYGFGKPLGKDAFVISNNARRFLKCAICSGLRSSKTGSFWESGKCWSSEGSMASENHKWRRHIITILYHFELFGSHGSRTLLTAPNLVGCHGLDSWPSVTWETRKRRLSIRLATSGVMRCLYPNSYNINHNKNNITCRTTKIRDTA